MPFIDIRYYLLGTWEKTMNLFNGNDRLDFRASLPDFVEMGLVLEAHNQLGNLYIVLRLSAQLGMLPGLFRSRILLRSVPL